MLWVTQVGSPGNDEILWPTRIPGRGSPTQDIDTRSGAVHTGEPEAILVTDWIDTNTTGARVELFTGVDPELFHTLFVRFPDSIPPYLPYRLELGDLSMPEPWAFRMKCTNGQFTGILLYR